MKPVVVSVCHSLQIIPTSRIIGFARIQSKVIMKSSGVAIGTKYIPGTIKVSAIKDNGIIKKGITFEQSGVSQSVADLFEGYKAKRFIATYIDETGNRRVAGSPAWPLSLDYTFENGVFKLTLQGEDTLPDGFMSE